MKDSEILVRYEVVPAEGYDLADIGTKIAQEQSLGGYRWSFERDFDVDAYRGRIHDIYSDPNSETGSIQIGFPVKNVSPEFSHLLNYIAGDVFGSTYVLQVRIRDVTFPDSFISAFPGPQFGIEGIRERAGVPDDHPLLGMIIKPSLGLSPERIGEIVRCAIDPEAYGVDVPEGYREGVDLIKEDEKLVDPSYCRFEDRLDEVVAALRWMREQTDRDVLYVLNVTDREHAFREYVEREEIHDVLDRFVLLQTVISNGFGRMADLASDDRFRNPLYAHRSGHAAYTRTEHGIAMRVLEKLSRLAGADFAHCGAVAGSHERAREDVIRNKDALVTTRSGWGTVRRSTPVVSGGVNPLNVYENVHDTNYDSPETDLAFMIGSGIYAQSGGTLDGIVHGITANRQAIHAAIEGLDADDVLETHSPTYAAAREWITCEESDDPRAD